MTLVIDVGIRLLAAQRTIGAKVIPKINAAVTGIKSD